MAFRRPSAQTILVLSALAAAPEQWRHGYDLCQETGVKSGSMYPILMRLVDRRLLETDWENSPLPGRPARHLYRITGSGLALLAQWADARSTTRQPRHTTPAIAPGTP